MRRRVVRPRWFAGRDRDPAAGRDRESAALIAPAAGDGRGTRRNPGARDAVRAAAPEGDLESAFFGALQGPQQVTQTADNVFLDGAHGRIVLAPAARDTGAG